jgi:hypothetical protein
MTSVDRQPQKGENGRKTKRELRELTWIPFGDGLNLFQRATLIHLQASVHWIYEGASIDQLALSLKCLQVRSTFLHKNSWSWGGISDNFSRQPEGASNVLGEQVLYGLPCLQRTSLQQLEHTSTKALTLPLHVKHLRVITWYCCFFSPLQSLLSPF